MRKIVLAFLAFLALTAIAKDNASYIYKRGDTSYIRSHGSLESVLRISKRWGGEFIWYNRNGRQYLIRDAATLAEVRAVFRELEALEPAHEQIAKKLRPLEKREQEIEEKLDAIADADEDEDEIVDEATVRELEKKMRVVEEQMRKVEKEMEQLEHKMEALEKVAEKRLEQIVERSIRNGVAERVD